MSKLINLSIDVSKITKSKLYQGKKGTYLKVTLALNDEADDYGNHASAWEEQTQEERSASTPKNYLGNGKVFWSKEPRATATSQNSDNNQQESDLPF